MPGQNEWEAERWKGIGEAMSVPEGSVTFPLVRYCLAPCSAAITECLRLVVCKEQELLWLMVLEAKKPEAVAPASSQGLHAASYHGGR